MRPTRIDDIREVLEDAMASGGVRAVLAFLNARAPHRFTGVYRVARHEVHNLHLFDEENPQLRMGGTVLLHETYCSITADEAAPFATNDTRSDSRLEEHPARESTLSYCGVPLTDGSGAALGTLCHFDLVPRPIPADEIEVMQAAVPLVMETLTAEGAFPRSG